MTPAGHGAGANRQYIARIRAEVQCRPSSPRRCCERRYRAPSVSDTPVIDGHFRGYSGDRCLRDDDESTSTGTPIRREVAVRLARRNELLGGDA